MRNKIITHHFIKKALLNKPIVLNYRPHYELQKVMWEFNPYDTDTNPRLSVPHGDDYSPTYHNYKLNVDDGRIYTARNRYCVGKICKKELKRLHQDPKFQKIKKEALNYKDPTRILTNSKNNVAIYRCELSTEFFSRRNRKFNER